MKEISLTRGKIALIDDEDFERIAPLKWYATNPRNKGWRAQHDAGGRKSRVRLSMARLIMGINPGDPRVIDHINHDTLDNRKVNLRVCSQQQNNMNVRGHRGSETGIKGIHLNKLSRLNPYRVQIQANGERHHIGVFPTLELAQDAYRLAATAMHGQFACTLSSTEG